MYLLIPSRKVYAQAKKLKGNLQMDFRKEKRQAKNLKGNLEMMIHHFGNLQMTTHLLFYRHYISVAAYPNIIPLE